MCWRLLAARQGVDTDTELDLWVNCSFLGGEPRADEPSCWTAVQPAFWQGVSGAPNRDWDVQSMAATEICPASSLAILAQEPLGPASHLGSRFPESGRHYPACAACQVESAPRIDFRHHASPSQPLALQEQKQSDGYSDMFAWAGGQARLFEPPVQVMPSYGARGTRSQTDYAGSASTGIASTGLACAPATAIEASHCRPHQPDSRGPIDMQQLPSAAVMACAPAVVAMPASASQPHVETKDGGFQSQMNFGLEVLRMINAYKKTIEFGPKTAGRRKLLASIGYLKTKYCSPALLKANARHRRFAITSEAKHIFKRWIQDHIYRPYPSQAEKEEMARLGNLSVKQVNDWFTNYRKRHWGLDVHNYEAAGLIEETEEDESMGWEDAID